MEITEVSVNLRDEEKLKGFASIVLDNMFIVRGLKIISGLKGYFIAMPNRKRKDGMFIDVAHPIRSEFRVEVERVVLDKYWEEVRRIQAEEMVETESDI